MASLTDLITRASEGLKLVPEVLALYNDLTTDGDLDTPDNLAAIVSFVEDKSEYLAEYISPGEVLMLVTGILGLLHKGDSTELYTKLLKQ